MLPHVAGDCPAARVVQGAQRHKSHGFDVSGARQIDEGREKEAGPPGQTGAAGLERGQAQEEDHQRRPQDRPDGARRLLITQQLAACQLTWLHNEPSVYENDELILSTSTLYTHIIIKL